MNRRDVSANDLTRLEYIREVPGEPVSTKQPHREVGCSYTAQIPSRTTNISTDGSWGGMIGNVLTCAGSNIKCFLRVGQLVPQQHRWRDDLGVNVVQIPWAP